MTTEPAKNKLASQGYRLPAEWERHAATWLAWPHNRETWPGAFDPIPGVWAELARMIAEHEPVHILAGGEAVMHSAQEHVGDAENITLHDIETNDAWIRDHGPMFLSGSAGCEPTLIDWDYNAWGGKYPPFDRDNAVPRQIAELIGCRRRVPGVVLEGGAVESNGQGTLLVNEACLLSETRNPGLSRDEVEKLFVDFCGARKVLWLTGLPDQAVPGRAGIAGDDTDGHVDQLVRFVGPATVVLAGEEDPQDENFALLEHLHAQLQAMTDAEGTPLKLIRLPMPRPLVHEGQRLPASYANFYITNGSVIVPKFDDSGDSRACEILAGLFPDREIRRLRAVDLIRGLGAVHCVTLSQPAVED